MKQNQFGLELDPASKWREENGVIYFSLTSDGTTGKEWIKRLEKKNFRLGDYSKKILLSNEFKPTSGVTTEIVVVKSLVFNKLRTKKICNDEDRRNLVQPHSEVACMLREKFSNQEIEALSLWFVILTTQSNNEHLGYLSLLLVPRSKVSKDFGNINGWVPVIIDD